ncbi:MAG: hypothetical protein AAF601_08680 [Pseudomonadota bacterium]
MEEVLVFAIPIVSVSAAGLFGWFSVHRRAAGLYMLGLMLILAGAALLYLVAEVAIGWDSLGYTLLMMFGALPAAAGLILGGGVGLITRPQLMLPS